MPQHFGWLAVTDHTRAWHGTFDRFAVLVGTVDLTPCCNSTKTILHHTGSSLIAPFPKNNCGTSMYMRYGNGPRWVKAKQKK
jgi:hypothetical protein